MFDQEKLDIECPNGHRVRVSIRDAQRSRTVRCSRCVATIEIDGSQFDRTLRDVERTLRRGFRL